VLCAHRALFERGFPCPELLVDMARFGEQVASAEEMTGGGGDPFPELGRSPEPFAEALAHLVALAPKPEELGTLEPAPPWTFPPYGTDLWPCPDDRDIDLNSVYGPAWIDESGRVARDRLQASGGQPEERIVLSLLQRLRPARERLSSLVTPETLRRWHRELVRRKWTRPHRANPRRRIIPLETQLLVWRLAKENPLWGYRRIQGELKKLGIEISASSIRRITSPKRRPGPKRDTWSQFTRTQAASIIACDLFTVESIRLKTHHVLFFIDLRTRQVLIGGVTDGATNLSGVPRSPAICPKCGSPAIFLSNSWSMTVTTGSAPPLTRCSRRRGSGSCARRGGHREPMPTPSGSSGPSEMSASTGSSS
jgi:hypothetical protein